jgi:hypothetical protein
VSDFLPVMTHPEEHVQYLFDNLRGFNARYDLFQIPLSQTYHPSQRPKPRGDSRKPLGLARKRQKKAAPQKVRLFDLSPGR